MKLITKILITIVVKNRMIFEMSFFVSLRRKQRREEVRKKREREAEARSEFLN